jgi:hypothetical protein
MGDAYGPRPCASRRVTLRCLALSAAVAIALGGCEDTSQTNRISYGLRKVCDHGRAVYFTGNRRGGVTVVENAPECSK